MVMNWLWSLFIIVAVIAAAFTGKMEAVLNNLFDFAQTAVDISLGLIGVMAFFCGLMKLMTDSHLTDKLAKVLAPLLCKLMPEVPRDHPAIAAMALWMAANMLGIGNAATPFGLKAMQELQTLNKTKTIATDAQVMMLAIGTTSVTLIPTDVLAVRSSIQAAGAAEIIMPTIIATTISTVVGIFFTWLFGKQKKYKYDYIIQQEMAAGTLEINEAYIGADPIILPDDYNTKYADGTDAEVEVEAMSEQARASVKSDDEDRKE